jgi:hypothetical protein
MSWQGGPNQGQVHRSTFYGNYLGTPHNVPGSMLPSHNGPHQATGRPIGRTTAPIMGAPEGAPDTPGGFRVPGFPNMATARGNTLKYTPPP